MYLSDNIVQNENTEAVTGHEVIVTCDKTSFFLCPLGLSHLQGSACSLLHRA